MLALVLTVALPGSVWLPTDSYPFILFPASNWIVPISFMYWNGSRNGVRCLEVQEFLPMAKCTIQKQDTKHLASRTKINDLTTIFSPLWSNWVFRKMPFPEKKKKYSVSTTISLLPLLCMLRQIQLTWQTVLQNYIYLGLKCSSRYEQSGEPLRFILDTRFDEGWVLWNLFYYFFMSNLIKAHKTVQRL